MLSRPCYILHPCQTASLLELLLPSLCDSPAARQHAPMAACEVQPAASAAVRAGEAVSPGHDPPAAALADAAPWQLRYMLAWWSIIGPAVQLALPANSYV